MEQKGDQGRSGGEARASYGGVCGRKGRHKAK
jgi:hypothetical protein